MNVNVRSKVRLLAVAISKPSAKSVGVSWRCPMSGAARVGPR